MDPALSSLFPIHQIGADGFSWWVGQIESEKNQDPKKSGRYRVRVVGQHLKDGERTPSDQLPWAQVMMPVTSPFSDGGVTGASVDLRLGNWVIGFYLDNDRQKPIIMGSIGHTAGATKVENVEEDPNPGATEKGFTTFLSPEVNPSLHSPMASKEKRNGDQPAESTTAEDNGLTTSGQAGQIAAAVPGQLPPAFMGLFAEASTTNPTGNKVCVEVANPNCGSENDLKGGLTNIIGEMLKATQQSGGNLGSFYVSKVNGELNSYVDHGMEYVNKAVRLVKSFIARVKGEIVKQIRTGVDELVELILYTEAATEEATDAAEGVKSEIDTEVSDAEAQPKESRLKPIFDTVNGVLDDLGCSMADLTDRLASWLTDLLLGYLMDAFSAAACLVDNLVNGILNQILSFIEQLIDGVLGPLQQILSAIASPLDMIGNAVNKVLNLLGISCDGPEAKCEKFIKECTDCSNGETEDWLDKLIADIENGPLDNSTYVCDEAVTTSAKDSLPQTDILFVGGTWPEQPTDEINTDVLIEYGIEDIEVTEGEEAKFIITRSGNVTKPSSIKFKVLGGTAVQGVDYNLVYSGSSVGFAPGATERAITFETYKDSEQEEPETFFVLLEENITPVPLNATFSGGGLAKCTILNYTNEKLSPPPGAPPTVPYVPPTTVNVVPVPAKPIPSASLTIPGQFVEVSTDKKFYSEGETIQYFVETVGYEEGALFNYTIEGTVDENDIEGDLTGSFELAADGTAAFTIKILTNDDDPDTDGGVVLDPLESITLFIDDTSAYADAYILADSDPDNTGVNTQPVWTVSKDVNYIKEGETVNFTIVSANVPDGTNFKYKLSGSIVKTDIIGYRMESSVDIDAKPLEIIDNQCVVPITATMDGIVEDEEYFTFELVSYVDGNGDDQPITGVSTQVSILSDDFADEDEEVTQAYLVSTEKLQYTEGDTITYNILTSNVPNGTVLQYTLYGTGISKDDFVSESLFGTFTIVNNTAKVYIGIAEDNSIEEDETVTFVINGTGASADVIINNKPTDEEDRPDIPSKDPCFDKPIAGKPITDANGSIISIPIIDRGCPYVFPPKVIITGPGYGSSGIALTDSSGRVSEVRVTRSGTGYNVNRPGELRCVIDSYTIISPGVGYTSEPDVYVDGKAGLATAEIDERGYVISIRPTDRTSTWNEIPAIRIVGGGGSGARVVPSITCLDTKEYEDQGYAKIGTGRYIDCP